MRDGYIPQEEVPLYESVGKKFSSKKTDLPVGMCPLVAASKDKKTKKKEPSPGIIILPKNTTQNNNIQQIKKQPQVNNTNSNNSKSNNTSQSQDVQSNHLESDAGAITTTNSTKKPPSSQQQSLNQTDRLAENLKDLQLYEEQEMSKKIRKLKKKIREIEVIETKLKSGELKNPDKDQLEKVKRKIDIVKEISNLESKFRPKD